MKNFSSHFARTLVIVLGVIAVVATRKAPQPEESGEILSFEVEATECSDSEKPVVRIYFRVTATTGSCFYTRIGGRNHMAIAGIDNIEQCGNGEWEGEYSFSLNAIFDDAIPSRFNVEGILRPDFSPTVNRPDYDSITQRIETRICN